MKKITNFLRGVLPTVTPLNLAGILIILAIWWLISALDIINSHILPSPAKTWSAFMELWNGERKANGMSLWENTKFSIYINVWGYVECIALALPVGFILGMNRITREMFAPIINSLRFVPITALGGVFVALSGLTVMTKINFLAFGIWVYLVPVIVQRITEVNIWHLQMLKTLGATKFQSFRHVTWMYVMSRLIDDIRILVGISWTYIIVAELKNIQGGLGALTFLGERQGIIGIVYAVVIMIILIGVVQDILFKVIDRLIFKFKYV